MKWPQKGRFVTEPGQALPGFIVFEGIDGAGTTTQTRLLVDRLTDAGVTAHLTNEPTNRPIGLLAREILAGTVPAPPDSVAHVFAADRADHVAGSDGILSLLESGTTVVCDRYKYSSLAYQGLDAGLELVSLLNDRFPDPELLIFVDLPAEVGEERLAQRDRRDIYENMSFQERVRRRYTEILEELPPWVTLVTVDGTRPAQEVSEKIWEAVESTSILRA